MRITNYDEAAEARRSGLARAFRELLHSRMLWMTGGIAIIGMMAGFVFYNSSAHLPLQNQSPEATQTAVQYPEPVSDSPVAAAVEEKFPAAADTSKPAPSAPSQVLAAAVSCDTNAQQQALAIRDSELAAEKARFDQVMSKRSGLKQLISAITGAITAPPSQDEVTKHEALISAINQRYQEALSAADCS